MYVAVCFDGAENAGTQKTHSRRGFSGGNGSLSIHSGKDIGVKLVSTDSCDDKTAALGLAWPWP